MENSSCNLIFKSNMENVDPEAYLSETYLEPSRTSTMELFKKMLNKFYSLTFIVKDLHRRFLTGF